MLRILNLTLVFIVATIFYWLGLIIFAPLELSVNIMLAFSIIIAVILPHRYGYTFAFFSGLFLDFLGTSLFGSHALAFTLLMVLFYHVRDKIDFKENTINSMVFGISNINMFFAKMEEYLANEHKRDIKNKLNSRRKLVKILEPNAYKQNPSLKNNIKFEN